MSGTKPSIQYRTTDGLASIMANANKFEKDIKKSSYQVLIIDDNINLLYSTQALVESIGYHCIIADGGEAGINVLNSMPIDIVLLDLSMPEVDGYSVLKYIQEKEFNTDVIVVSGESTFDNATNVFKSGALDFLGKPYKSSQLISTIDNVAYKRGLKLNLKAMQIQLEESEKRYRFIVSYSPDIIYMIDHRGFFTFLNERITDLLGYKPEELIGEHFSSLVHEDDLAIAEHIFNERRTGDRSSQNVEFRLKSSDPEVQSKPFESSSIVIELCSMGVYEENDDGTPYLGTYGVARDISDRKKDQEMIHFQAYHDLLTRLPNRELFLDRMHLAISQAERKKTKLAVLFLDMDGFKFINDSLGHVIGDSLLQRVAFRLQETLRDTDTISRIGGDEFNILIPELKNREEAGLVAEKILDAFSHPIILDHHEITITFSIGISVFPDDATSTEELIKNSDMAMYHIKGRGKNGYEFFSDHMQSIYQYRHNIEQDIRKALDNDQFEAYYQPQYDINTQEIIGLEALIRWNHPEKGLITPDEFIPIAEEIGLICEIGRYMLKTGCKQLKTWLDEGIKPLKLSINVSAYQLAESNFDVVLCDLIKKYDIPHHLLMVEITETSLMQDMEQAIPRLKNLVKCGIGICIDDFGVGYSSLSYLQILPIDILKVDRSFLSCITENHEKACIIKAIVAMARELELEVVVEGVETVKQLNYIKNIGCTIVQGFLLGRPLPVNEVSKLLK
ncbi:MAG: EAL domain-containing protein [Gammaproteobacteria bacterium]|jgi:diguanylate cyclase (GGDEF)-like protein/PAS domain S-box-containing protein|nr:EAL domain-containing protein [Gammaproteobacteria bacterium]